MDTHDEINNAGSKRPISSDFEDKSIPQYNDGKKSPDNNGSINTNTPKAASWNRQEDSNPYRFTQQTREKGQNGKIETDILQKTKKSSLFQNIKGKFSREQKGSDDGRQKLMMVLIPILAVIFIFVIKQVFYKTPQQTQAATDDKLPANVKTGNDELVWKVPEPLPVAMRDLTKTGKTDIAQNDNQSASSNQMQSGMLQIRSIVHSNDKSSVVIGDKIIHLNEKINGATVIEIGQDFVVFEKDGVREVKRVSEESPFWQEVEEPKQDQIVTEEI